MLPCPPLSLTDPVRLSRKQLPHLSPDRSGPTKSRRNSPGTNSSSLQVPENVSPCRRVPSFQPRSETLLHALRLRHLFCSPIDERVHHYQRGRASITGLGLWSGKIIETERLVGVVTARLVILSFVLALVSSIDGIARQ